MKFTTPHTLQHRHDALHEQLRHATPGGREVGEAARVPAQSMHPHFVEEYLMVGLGVRHGLGQCARAAA